MKKIAKYVTGSVLYGMETVKSDIDYGGIFKSDFADIILGRDEHTIKEEGVLNTPQVFCVKTESTHKELRSFVKDACEGQSYAIEALYVPEKFILETSPEFEYLRENREKLVGNLQPLVSYCRAMAHKFTIRGEKLESLRKAIKSLQDVNFHLAKLEEVKESLYIDEHCKFTEHETKKGTEEMYSVSKCYLQLSVTVKHALNVLLNKEKKYGKRTKDSLEKGADWKAYSHALRMSYQFIELMETKNLEFPCWNAKHLKNVKLGLIPVEEVEEELDWILDKVESYDSVKDDKYEHFKWDEWLVNQYGENK